jgi:hypothetical protein
MIVIAMSNKVKFVLSYDEWYGLSEDERKSALSKMQNSKSVALQTIYRGLIDMMSKETDVSFFHYYGGSLNEDNNFR